MSGGTADGTCKGEPRVEIKALGLLLRQISHFYGNYLLKNKISKLCKKDEKENPTCCGPEIFDSEIGIYLRPNSALLVFQLFLAREYAPKPHDVKVEGLRHLTMSS